MEKGSLGRDNTYKQETVYPLQKPLEYSLQVGCWANTGRDLTGSSEQRRKRKAVAGDEVEKVDVHALLGLGLVLELDISEEF